jgi:F-type H+-transporting ATPase subunit epsilon
MSTIRVDVVSAEQSIFSGEAKFVALPGESGELGILRGHTPVNHAHPPRFRAH